MEKTQSYQQSIFLLYSLDKKNLSLESQNIITQLARKMEILLRDEGYVRSENDKKSNENLDFIQMIENEELYSLFNEELMKKTALQIKFWKSFLENEPKIFELYQISTQLTL